MTIPRYLRGWSLSSPLRPIRALRAGARKAARPRRSFQPTIEVFESRNVLSGPSATASLVKIINLTGDAFTLGANADVATNVNGTLYFTANDGSHGRELWKSDGTSAGTVLVKDINPGSGSSGTSRELTNVNGTLFFTASDG